MIGRAGRPQFDSKGSLDLKLKKSFFQDLQVTMLIYTVERTIIAVIMTQNSSVSRLEGLANLTTPIERFILNYYH